MPFLMAAGGIVEGRGVAAALVLGAVGVAMRTRFLASAEANIAAGTGMRLLELWMVDRIL
jgi:nitronate monooxygenase